MSKSYRLEARQPLSRISHVLLVALPLAVSGTQALGQSSVGRAANGATGQSLRDAVEKIQQDALDGEVRGAPRAVDGGGASTSSGGVTLGAAANPSGRLRRSQHDPLQTRSADENNYGWTTREGSVFGTGIVSLPGTVLGGQVKLTGFGGHNWLSLEMKNGGGNVLDVSNGQFGEASNESFLLGGSLLWSKQSTYLMTTFVGMWGETELKDAIDFCNGPGLGCPLRKYSFDTRGFVGSLTAGHVFVLGTGSSAPMLDVRGVASYTQNHGDDFANFQGDIQQYRFSVWTLTGSATLFTNIAMNGGALLRPYLQGYVRQEVGYRNRLAYDLLDPTEIPNSGTVHWDQSHTYGGVDAGLSYVMGNMTLGTSLYLDGSRDERTVGGRVGVSWKLN